MQGADLLVRQIVRAGAALIAGRMPALPANRIRILGEELEHIG
jgi:hypothetical protein